MREFIKVLCVVVLMVGLPGAAVAWSGDAPDLATWIWRVAAPIATFFALTIFLMIHFRPDAAKDFLGEKVGSRFFNRDGFCFALAVTERDGYAHLVVDFQNQFERACVGRVALRPARGFWMTRAQMDWIMLEIACPPAGFGVAMLPIAIPLELQGSRQSFDVGASAIYPEGKGKQLRFRDGIVIRSSAQFQNPMGDGLFIAGMATGQLVLSEPAKVTLDLPSGVETELPKALPLDLKVLWRLGDSGVPPVVR